MIDINTSIDNIGTGSCPCRVIKNVWSFSRELMSDTIQTPRGRLLVD